MQFRPIFSLVFLALAPAAAHALNPVTWQFDLTTTGQDVFWTSPTAVTPGLPEYDWSYNISKVEARVVILFIPVDVDVTDQLGDATMGGGTAIGLPFEFVNQTVSDPTTGTTADVLLYLDANGFGHASITNVTLGQYNGSQITRLRAQGTATVLGIPQGDFTRDGKVDSTDYQAWTTNFGSATSANADGNKNGIVDAADYVLWRRMNGTDATSGSAAAEAVPEPGASVFAIMLSGLFLRRRYRASRVGRKGSL